MSNKQLYSIDNYNKYFNTEETYLCIHKYIEITQQFLMQASENVFIQYKKYHKFVIQRGLETIKHIFNHLILYTKNIDLTYYHTQKACCYYIEFISQISDEHHSFLRLSSKDATLFVYKKSIYDINQDYRKTFELNDEEKEIFLIISTITKYYNDIIIHNINNNDILIENGNTSKLMFYIISQNKKLINYVFESTYSFNRCKKIIKLAYFTLYYLNLKELDYKKIYTIIITLLKKIIPKNINIEDIQKKIISEEFNLIKENTPLRITNWLLH